MRKNSKTCIISLLLVIVALGLFVFDQLNSSPQSPAHSLASKKVAYLGGETDTQDKSLSVKSAEVHFPLQALKVEETNFSVTQRVRTTCNLLSIIPLLFGFELASHQSKAKFLYEKPSCLTAPIYILFRQILQ